MIRLAIAAGLLAAASPALAEHHAEGTWVGSWTASPHAPLTTEGPFAAASYEDVTISQVIRLSEGGSKLRVRFTNRYGPAPLAIGEARIVLLDDDGNEVAGSSRPLTFGGEAGAVIPRGAPFASDVVDLETQDFQKAKLVFYLPEDTGPCTCHLTGLDTLAVSAPGNHVGADFEPASTAMYRAFLHTVEVLSPDAQGTIVTYGDSITDGVGSTPGADRRWPDVLAERLEAAGMEYAVANAGISGNRVLSPGMGESALSRFDEDVLSLPNVTHMIIFVGVNDIGNRYGPVQGGVGGFTLDQPQIDASQMIAGYRQLIARAHEKGIKVIGSPIGPYKGASYWSEEGEAARQTINNWILNSGEFDATVRLDTAFADPADPAQMREGYHMGDFLHGSDAGLKAVGEIIDLGLFAGG
ncbi:SGNH/GDSL hydrolase family protein [Alteraurantiacibacter aquimixticola]|uniref:SGNH/GDSL hydrolase family protein n=1 Tax=Alteraurantiacibacter aquimixticola TaxID=2489173 RepID=A0A4T3EXZ2_9SPHN|nr:SGNH/GDSL hydrolase family protein [Alteraurantiacibacter aquimixticola]TIX48911.1 SGNH/GDSL hydrolase family protein [Alteraurantiacibacter aquimixticola]